MTPDAPDVAEMVAWCEASIERADLLARDYASARDDAAMLRAIAERLRARGGDHDAG